MISFIVIGRNIERTIELCLKGVFNFIEVEGISDAEVIYVDSDSSDRSVELARKTNATIIHLKGEVNAAAGRNVGAEHSKGDILFFLDGDMELLPGFLGQMMNESGKLRYPFCTGFWNEVYYNKHWTRQRTDLAEPPAKHHHLVVTGGLMIIEKNKWNEMGGMDERFTRSQDHDLGLRMNQAGTPVRKLPVVMVNHHTISYFEGLRIGTFFAGTAVLCQGMLMRKHFFDVAYLKRYSAKTLYAFMFIIASAAIPIKPYLGGSVLGIYLLIHFARSARSARSGGTVTRVIGTFVFHTLFSAYAAIGFLFYYPAQPKYVVSVELRKPV